MERHREQPAREVLHPDAARTKEARHRNTRMGTAGCGHRQNSGGIKPMSLLRNLVIGLRALFRREKDSKDLDEELDEFLEMAAEDKVRRGMTRGEAVRAVRLEEGSSDMTRGVVHAGGGEAFLEICGQCLR